MDMQKEGYRVAVHGVELWCSSIEQVVEVVKAFEARDGDREVPVPTRTDREVEMPQGAPLATSALTRELYALMHEAPRALRPVEIIRALRKRGVTRAQATYQRVYGALRHGEFEKEGGRWSASA